MTMDILDRYCGAFGFQDYLLFYWTYSVISFGGVTFGFGTAANTWEPTAHRNVCQWQPFEASCGNDEVLIVTNARYGRMTLGPCVQEDLGRTGCYADILHLVDRKCSGRPACIINIPDPEFEKERPCPELANYLEVSYTCQKVISESPACFSCTGIVLTSSRGYLSNYITDHTECGSTECPWIVRGQKGQKVNVFLYDFDRNDEHDANTCRVYAVVKETQPLRSVTVCGGRQRKKLVFESSGPEIEIRILTKKFKNQHNSSYFLLLYEVIGCPELQSNDVTWFRQNGNMTSVGCHHKNGVTFLTCNGTSWIGHQPNCTNAPLLGAQRQFFSLTHSFSVIIIVCVSVTISCLILVIGVVVFKRREHQYDQPNNDLRHLPLTETELTYMPPPPSRDPQKLLTSSTPITEYGPKKNAYACINDTTSSVDINKPCSFVVT